MIRRKDCEEGTSRKLDTESAADFDRTWLQFRRGPSTRLSWPFQPVNGNRLSLDNGDQDTSSQRYNPTENGFAEIKPSLLGKEND